METSFNNNKPKQKEECHVQFFLVVVGNNILSNLKMPITSIEANDLNNVWEIQTWGKEHDEDDWKLLEMVANQVHPIIMCKHN